MDSGRQGQIARLIVKDLLRENEIKFFDKNSMEKRKKKAEEFGVNDDELKEFMKILAHEIINEAP